MNKRNPVNYGVAFGQGGPKARTLPTPEQLARDAEQARMLEEVLREQTPPTKTASKPL